MFQRSSFMYGHSRKSMAPRRSTLQLWTPKMKNRDERKRVISMCLAKIKKIEDRDSCLLRSVLVTNILKKLQQESEHESKHVPSATPSSSLSGSRTDKPASNDLDFDNDILNFSDFYLPPTPRMISSLEEDEVLGLELPSATKETIPPPLPEPVYERPLTDEETLEQLVPTTVPILVPEGTSAGSLKRSEPESNEESGSSEEPESKKSCPAQAEINFVSSMNNSGDFEVDRTYTCAQSSMFCDLHNAVFHGIMTSLES
ncbi:uncharacterized protein LOC136028870 [Artemia franciscana]|uniref:SERTA domain-containing protein n=1 Tax=Artemia franciscana TaxID=6661 RepID=A0AA88H9D6_ARTSF|nr:hypothetical protein QYM36_015136 [Artemia franciscana]